MHAYLLKKLQETRDGDGSLLDHSLVLFGSSLSESNLHTHDDLPIVLAGGANGQIKGNRHLVYPSGTQLNNLLLNMFDAADVPHVSVSETAPGACPACRQAMARHTRRYLLLAASAWLLFVAVPVLRASGPELR